MFSSGKEPSNQSSGPIADNWNIHLVKESACNPWPEKSAKLGGTNYARKSRENQVFALSIDGVDIDGRATRWRESVIVKSLSNGNVRA